LEELELKLAAADFELLDCLENNVTILMSFDDVDELRRLARIVGDGAEDVDLRWVGRVVVRNFASIPVTISMTRASARVVLRAVKRYVEELEAFAGPSAAVT
jgi:hypothetical protein